MREDPANHVIESLTPRVVEGCCWLVFDKKRATVRFCHWPRENGRLYCPAHPGDKLPTARPAKVAERTIKKLSHSQVVRIIAGACENASHGHPDWYIDPRLARSIAKRAAGTLMAAMPDVLAAPGALSLKGAATSTVAPSADDRIYIAVNGAGGSSNTRAFWRPFMKLVGQMETLAVETGNRERAQTIRDVRGIFDATLVREAHGKPEPTLKAPRQRRAKYQPAPYRDTIKPTGVTLADVWPQ